MIYTDSQSYRNERNKNIVRMFKRERGRHKCLSTLYKAIADANHVSDQTVRRVLSKNGLGGKQGLYKD